jgi:hypothetical protein
VPKLTVKAEKCSLVEELASTSSTIIIKDTATTQINSRVNILPYPTLESNSGFLTIKERAAMLRHNSSFSSLVKLLQFKLPA